MSQACPKFVANGIDVMTQDERGIRMSILQQRLVIELKHVPGRVERTRTVFVHREMRHGLVGEEIWFAFHLQKTIDGEGPIEFVEQQESARIDRIAALRWIAQETFVTGKLAIGEIICGRVAG